MSGRVPALALLLAVVAVGVAPAQVTYPPAPEKYQVQLRYRIRAAQAQRIAGFEALEKHLKQVGFVHADEKAFQDEMLDPAAEIATGTIPAGNVPKLFDNPTVQTVLLTPVGADPFADPKKVVQVRIDLNAKLAPREQKLLHEQAADQLAKLGLVQAVGYDHAGYTRIRGAMPAGNVPSLLKDLRSLPAGWFLGGTDRAALPLPISAVTPVRVVTVLPDTPTAPALPDGRDLGKLTPDLKAALADPAAADKPIVVEAVLDYDTTGRAGEVRTRLRTAISGIMVEGFAGSVVTLRLPTAKQLSRVTDDQDVRHVRLPRAATETTALAPDQPTPDFAAASGLGGVHAMGYDGGGVTVAVIASEFPGAVEKVRPVAATDKMVTVIAIDGVELPPGSRIFDLTGEVNPTLESRPVDPNRSPGGSATALAAHHAAPKAAVVLVRIDPTRMHQLLSVARAVVGEEVLSTALATRSDELSVRGTALESRRKAASQELQRAFSDLSDDEKPMQRRDAAAAAMKELQTEENDHKQRLNRFLALKNGLDSLRGIGVVVNTLVWETGHPHDGLSEASRLIERAFGGGASGSGIRALQRPATPAWVQAGSTAVGSVWSGPFLDSDANGVMEFAAAGQPIPAGRWTRELNFLGYRAGGKGGAIVPAGSKLRVTLQWREPHNPDVVLPAEPTIPFTLRLFRQLDPTGQTVASDDLVEVARSVGDAVRLLKTAGSGVYEVTLDVTTPAEGVYALRVEKGVDQTGLPAAAKVSAEIRARLIVELTDPVQSAAGRVGFDTFAVQNSGVGIPGDSPAAVTVGTLDPTDPTKSSSVTGVGPGVSLGVKPELLATGAITLNKSVASGTGVASGSVGGLAACLMQAGVRPSDLVKSLGLTPGSPLVLPSDWVRSLRPGAVGRSDR
jgi:hypothetical protein